jgi:hypothetical protein
MNGSILPFVIPLFPLLGVIVWIGFLAIRKFAPASFHRVGARGFVFAYLTVICIVCLRAALGSTGFTNALVAELFVSLPYVALVVLPTVICSPALGKYGMTVSLSVSVGVAILGSYLNQYLSVHDAQLAISRGNSLIPSVVMYAVSITASVYVAISVAGRLSRNGLSS